MAKDNWNEVLASHGFTPGEQQVALNNAYDAASKEAKQKVQSGEDTVAQGRLARTMSSSAVTSFGKLGYGLHEIEEGSPPAAMHYGYNTHLRWDGGDAYTLHSAATGDHIATVPLGRVGWFLKDTNSKLIKRYLQRQLEKHDKPN
jgi:hypothetical protein